MAKRKKKPVKKKVKKPKKDPQKILLEAAKELGAVDPDQLPAILKKFKKEVKEMEKVVKEK